MIVIKHKMKKAQKKNEIERLKELQIKLQEQEDKNLKIKDKRENKNNSYKLVIKRRENVKFLLPPFGNLYEEPLSYYTLQLNLYSLCLAGIGLPPIAARVIWLKDDGNYELIPINLLYKEEWFKNAF